MRITFSSFSFVIYQEAKALDYFDFIVLRGYLIDQPHSRHYHLFLRHQSRALGRYSNLDIQTLFFETIIDQFNEALYLKCM